MVTVRLVLIGVVSVALSGSVFAKMVDKSAKIYKERCSNCHGITANGVPKLSEQPGMNAEQANAGGTASQEKGNIYGPPLNVYSKEDLVQKLTDLRNKDFDTSSYHSVMKKNLKKIEEREGKISDEKMAEYIVKNFGTSK